MDYESSGALQAWNTLPLVPRPHQDLNAPVFSNHAPYQLGEDLPADGDNDGFVGNTDYAIWADHFGETNLSTSTTVPEPTTWFLLGAGLSTLALRRR